MESIWDHFMCTQHACCRRRDKSRRVLLVSELTAEDFREIEAAEVPPEHDYLNAERSEDQK